MCNLYSLTRDEDAIRQLARAMRDSSENLPSLLTMFPDAVAPDLRTADDGEREWAMMRWGFPSPPKAGDRPVTNVLNTE